MSSKTTKKIKPKPQPPPTQVYESLVTQTLPGFNPMSEPDHRLPLTIEEYAGWGSL